MKKRLSCILLLLMLLSSVLQFPVSAQTGKTPLEEVSFFGDSTTYGLIRYIVNNTGSLGIPVVDLRRDQILVPPDGTFYLRNLPTATLRYQNQTLSLKEAFQKAAPKILIVTVGVNGLPTWTEEDFTAHYNRLLELIRWATPNTRIILQSVYPVAKERSPRLKAFTSDKIDFMNQWIKAIAKVNRLDYLDTASVLKAEDGWLNPTYHNGDGLHLNTTGFNQVLTYIIQQLNEKGR